MAVAAIAAAQAWPSRPHAAEPHRLSCLSNPETQDAMLAHKAVAPFRAVTEALRAGGDLVAIRLCRAPDVALVYDVAVLRGDGHLVHVMIDATTGSAVPARR